MAVGFFASFGCNILFIKSCSCFRFTITNSNSIRLRPSESEFNEWTRHEEKKKKNRFYFLKPKKNLSNVNLSFSPDLNFSQIASSSNDDVIYRNLVIFWKNAIWNKKSILKFVQGQVAKLPVHVGIIRIVFRFVSTYLLVPEINAMLKTHA